MNQENEINENNESVTTKQALKFLWKYLKKGLPAVITGILCLICADYFQIVIYKIVSKTIDILSIQSVNNRIILKNAIYILLLALGMAAFRFCWRHFIIGFSRKTEKKIRDDMFNHMQSLSFSFFNRTKTGDLMALLINDLSAIQRVFGFGIVILVDVFFLGTMALIAMFQIDVRLTLISISPLPLIVLIMIFFGRLIEIKFKKVQESFSVISSHAQESLSGIRVIKGFVQEEADAKSFHKDTQDYVDKNLDLIRFWGLFFPSINFLASIATGLFYLFGLKGVILQSISIGEAIAFLSYLNMIVWPMIGIGFAFNMLSRGLASTKRIKEMMDTKPEIADRNVRQIERIRGNIEIRNLTFSYYEIAKTVLKNINLSIPAGSSLGIMGKPGGGKSTLVALLFHLFHIEEGKIFIDGIDINEVPLKTLRSAIGYVPQDSFLFSDTIANNIAFGIPDDNANPEKIREYARIASVHKEIEKFTEGYETIVGERGITLSGGQKQRVSIARALMVEPSILILDDALSAVDAKTETAVLSHIKKEIKRRTSIIISHRISTVKDCDNIIVLDDGAVAEQGNHSQLLAKGGYYSRLFELQSLSEEMI
jgi:ATP-binding cassette, subfamily B, multidrug efflux pump